MSITNLRPNLNHWQERVDLAAAFRWTARLNMHEGVANHFSLAVNDDGTRFLMNPNQIHFSRVKASDMLVIDANDPETLSGPNAPDPTAWGLHGGLHRHCAHARCAMHVHSIHATVLASLADSRLPPIDQNCATFFNRYVIDEHYGGLAFEDEGAALRRTLQRPQTKSHDHGQSRRSDHWRRQWPKPSTASTISSAPQKPTSALCKRASPFASSPTTSPKRPHKNLKTTPNKTTRHLGELKAILDEESCNYAT